MHNTYICPAATVLRKVKWNAPDVDTNSAVLTTLCVAVLRLTALLDERVSVDDSVVASATVRAPTDAVVLMAAPISTAPPRRLTLPVVVANRPLAFVVVPDSKSAEKVASCATARVDDNVAAPD